MPIEQLGNESKLRTTVYTIDNLQESKLFLHKKKSQTRTEPNRANRANRANKENKENRESRESRANRECITEFLT